MTSVIENIVGDYVNDESARDQFDQRILGELIRNTTCDERVLLMREVFSMQGGAFYKECTEALTLPKSPTDTRDRALALLLAVLSCSKLKAKAKATSTGNIIPKKSSVRPTVELVAQSNGTCMYALC
jgi:hypothetical protein